MSSLWELPQEICELAWADEEGEMRGCYGEATEDLKSGPNILRVCKRCHGEIEALINA